MKITVLDKGSIKVGFPINSKEKWFKILQNKEISYVVFEKINGNFEKVDIYKDKPYSDIFKINLEDYKLTYERILQLNQIGLEDKNEKHFLLAEKVEEVYILVLDLLIRLPRKERFFIRNKIETLFMDVLEKIYVFKYNLEDRKSLIEIIFNKIMIIREFIRLLYKIGVIKSDPVFLYLGGKFVEILKICKGIKNKF